LSPSPSKMIFSRFPVTSTKPTPWILTLLT
jgi:hypothetical protein